MESPRCIIIARPNGAGKTTFAREYLPKDAGVIHFVNADLLAAGLSPLEPDLAALKAGRLFLAELDRLAMARQDFSFESTLSGLTHVARIKRWKSLGYRIGIVYLRLASAQLALHRITGRVEQGGHNVPQTDVLRRYNRSWRNFEDTYKPLADSWQIYDNSQVEPQLLESRQ
jgi:predicted ABC-type ATPase